MSDEASRRSPWVSETGADGATSRQAEEEAEPFQVKRAVQADMGRGLEPLRAALTNHRKGSFFTTADDEVKIYYNAQEATWAGQGQDWRVQESVILTIFVLQGVPSQDRPAASRQTHLQPARLVWGSRERLYVQESTLRGWGGHSLSWERCWGEGRLMHLGVGQGLGRWILLFFLSSAPLLESHRKAIKQDVVCSTASFRRVKSFWGRHKGPGLQTSWSVQMGVLVRPGPLSHWGMCPGQRY